MANMKQPQELFEQKLGTVFSTEKQLVDVLGKFEREAKDEQLKEQFSHHRKETQGQVKNIEQVFSALGMDSKEQKSPAFEGLVKEGEQLMGKATGDMLDAVLLGAAAATEHHEIAAYESLITMAEAMGEDDVVSLLQENLEQEKHTLQEVQKHGERLTKQVVKSAG
jgi:ferritin-like metal-binding protein YciE